MLKNLWNKFNSKNKQTEEKSPAPRRILFSTDDTFYDNRTQQVEEILRETFDKGLEPFKAVRRNTAMDSIGAVKNQFVRQYGIADSQVLWYASQGFIGYQLCALLAQQWLISQACLQPAEDATRKGYEVTVNDGSEIDAEILSAIREADKRYKLRDNLIQFIHLGRVFGIRIAIFQIESDDPDYYKKPFNPDGIKPGSYKGISQIDPYWITPQLDDQSAGNPASINFYEPTWWNINGRLHHHSHLIIYRTEEVPDILKPSYLYGGVPIPQKIYERVYAAERTANEAPMLALTKRVDIYKTDLEQALANEQDFFKRMQKWIFNRDNYQVKIIDRGDEMAQFDTSIADLDAVIMNQYQLVAAAAKVPAVKLLGTSPKGFNATGEFEEASYHETLESLQTHGLTPLIQRHHLLLIRSEIAPQFDIEPFETTVVWNPLDAMTAKEQAEVNKVKADTGATLIAAGVIDGMDERKRIINDPTSGYSGLLEEDEDLIEEVEEEEGAELDE